MKINELHANGKIDFIEARILSKNGPKSILINNQKQHSWELLLRDETGTVILVLIGANNGEMYKLNSIVKIVNGECRVSRDQYQLLLGEGNIQHMPDNPTIPRTLL